MLLDGARGVGFFWLKVFGGFFRWAYAEFLGSVFFLLGLFCGVGLRGLCLSCRCS